MTDHRQSLAIGIAAGLVAGLLLGAGAVLAQQPKASSGISAPGAAPSGTTSVGGTTSVAGTPSLVDSGPAAGVASSGTAIAYPYFGGAVGIAPDHTIVVTGFGQADLKANGSNRASARKAALDAALVDAKAQADAIAAATRLTISGVLSVSASVSSFGPVPYAIGASGSGSTSVPAPGAPEPTTVQSLSVSVTVAYSVS
jgi:hypothetical protein